MQILLSSVAGKLAMGEAWWNNIVLIDYCDHRIISPNSKRHYICSLSIVNQHIVNVHERKKTFNVKFPIYDSGIVSGGAMAPPDILVAPPDFLIFKL